MVGITNRSIAVIPSVWLRRNVRQSWDGSGLLLRAMYLATLVCPTSMPSFKAPRRFLELPTKNFRC
jgi:hypothetical protein